MQKLITIQTKAEEGTVKEFLGDYLKDGWRIISVSAAGAGQEGYRSFLVAVVLEKLNDRPSTSGSPT